MKRITYEEYQSAIETIKNYKTQCELDLSLIEIEDDNYKKDLLFVSIGQSIKVVKDVKPAKYFRKGETYVVLDRNPKKGLQIRNKKGGSQWIPFSNTFGRWGY